MNVYIKNYNLEINNTVEVYSDNNISFTDTITDIKQTDIKYYRNSILGRNKNIKYLGYCYIVYVEEITLESGLTFKMYKETITSKYEDVSYENIKNKPDTKKQILESNLDLNNFQYQEIESYTDYLLISNNEKVFTITYPYNSIPNEYYLDKNKGIYFNNIYTLITAKEYNQKKELEESNNKYNKLISEGFKQYSFDSYLHTNRQGFLKLIIDGIKWNGETNEDVIILDHNQTGGGGRYSNYHWNLMIRDTCEIEEIFEGDFIESNTNISNGNNPFEGLSKLFKK